MNMRSNSDNNLQERPRMQRKISYRPEKAPRLVTYDLSELESMCEESNINLQQFCGLSEEEKKNAIIKALIATYPPEHQRKFYNKLNVLKDKKVENFDLLDEEEINQLFSLLLSKLGVSNTSENSLHQKLMKSFSIVEKFQHLQNSVCVLDDDPNFMEEDENMITIMDSDRFIDSIRLLTCKYRILNSSPEWLENFCTSGGISVLVENMDNRLDKDPMPDTDAAALLQLIDCIKHIINTDGLNIALDTRGAIDAFCMSLRFSHPKLALEILEVLAVVCTYGGKDGVSQTVMGLLHLARSRNEKPFEILVDAMCLPNPLMKVKVIALVNALLNANIDLCERVSHRNDLKAVEFDKVLTLLLLESPSPELLARRKMAVEKLRQSSKNRKFQAGFKISSKILRKQASRFGTDDPASGAMSGICWEVTKGNEGAERVEKKWCDVIDGVFSWYDYHDKEENPFCAAEKHQNMASVVEIMGYSTAHSLQRMFKDCFAFQCSDETRYQFGVEDRETKERWMVALQSAMARASQERTAYTLTKHLVTQEEFQEAQKIFLTEIDTYHGIEQIDKELLLEEGREGLIPAAVIAGYVQSELVNCDPKLETDYIMQLSKVLLEQDPEKVASCLRNVVLDNLSNNGIVELSNELEIGKDADCTPVMREAVISSRLPPQPPPLPGTPLGLPGIAPPLPGSAPPRQQNSSIKMRKFYWTTINPIQVSQTVWSSITEPTLDDNLKAILQNDFVDARKTTKTENKTQKPKKVSIFKSKKAQNVAIAVRKIRKSPDEIRDMIIDLDSTTLNAEATSILLELCPTDDDIRAVEGLNGTEDLDLPSTVMTRLVEIPRLQQRLQTHSITLAWEASAKLLQTKLNFLNEAVSEIQNDSCLSSLKTLFSYVLAVGNYINNGASNDRPRGIKLISLLKLVEHKINGSTEETLLHRVLQAYRAQYPNDIFYSGWDRNPLNELTSNFEELYSLISFVRKELMESVVINLRYFSPLQERLNDFLSRAENQYANTAELIAKVQQSIKDLRQSFGEPPDLAETETEGDSAQTFFESITNFAEQCKKALVIVDVWAERERRQQLLSPILLDVVNEEHKEGPTVAVPVSPRPSDISVVHNHVDLFREYQVGQNRSSEDRISYFKRMMRAFRRGLQGRGPARVSEISNLPELNTVDDDDDDDDDEQVDEDPDVADREWNA